MLRDVIPKIFYWESILVFFNQKMLVGSTSGFCGAGIRPNKAENELNSVVWWQGRAVQPTPKRRRALFERSEFARRRGRRTAQGTRRASLRPQWF
jgi:hypothetical protein